MIKHSRQELKSCYLHKIFALIISSHILKIYVLLRQHKVRWLIAQAPVINAAKTAVQFICCKCTACALYSRLCYKGQFWLHLFLRASVQPAVICCEAMWKNLGLRMAEISLGTLISHCFCYLSAWKSFKSNSSISIISSLYFEWNTKDKLYCYCRLIQY